MNDAILNISYIEHAIDQVLTDLNLAGELLTQSEKLEHIKLKNENIYAHLMELIDKGVTDLDFESNRNNLVESLKNNK